MLFARLKFIICFGAAARKSVSLLQFKSVCASIHFPFPTLFYCFSLNSARVPACVSTHISARVSARVSAHVPACLYPRLCLRLCLRLSCIGIRVEHKRERR